MKIYLFLCILLQFVCAFNQHFVKNILPQDFEKEVLQANLPVFFQISVSWCSPCKILKPIFEELSIEFKDRALFLEIDVAPEENRDILQTIFQNYGVIVCGFPIIFIFNNGMCINFFNARMPNKEELAKVLDNFFEEIKNKN